MWKKKINILEIVSSIGDSFIAFLDWQYKKHRETTQTTEILWSSCGGVLLL